MLVATFGAYEVSKHTTLAYLHRTFPEQDSVQTHYTMTYAGLASICAGSVAAGVVQYTVGHVWDAVREHAQTSTSSRAAVSLWRAAIPSLTLCLATLPAQIIGFLAFEYSKELILNKS